MRRLGVVLCAILLVLVLGTFFSPPLAAQDGMAVAAEGGAVCLKWGAVLAVAISLLKRMPFGIGRWIGAHPALIATFLSTVAGLAPLIKGSGATIAQLAVCIAAYFAGSQGMYQGVLKPLAKFAQLPEPYTS